MQGLPTVESLQNVHDFPGRYTFKAFGPAEQHFVDEARSVVVQATAGRGDEVLSARLSKQGRYMCVTLDVFVQSPEQVRAIYVELSHLEGLRMLL